jgi:RNA polymerase sigma-70 factor (ECF subfamily)
MRYCVFREEKAFEEIFNRYFDIVYRFVCSRVLDRYKAEEITSSVFSILVDNLNKFDKDANLNSFIFGIALNKIRHSWRDKSLCEESFLEVFDISIEEVESSANFNKLNKILPKILDTLPENYRFVLQERFINGTPNTEIGKSLDISTNNVRVLIHRALKKAAKIGNKILENENKI